MSYVNMNRFARISAVLIGTALFTACGTNRGTVTNAIGTGGFQAGGCVPVNQPINFQGQNAYIDQTTIRAGQIPSGWGGGSGYYQAPGGVGGQQGGSIVQTGGAGAPQGTPGTLFVQSYNGEGSISIALNAFGGNFNTNKQINGTLTLGQISQQYAWQAYSYIGAQQGTVPGGNGQPCVSSLGIQAYYNPNALFGTGFYNGNSIYSAIVYIFLNNTQHGFWINLAGI